MISCDYPQQTVPGLWSGFSCRDRQMGSHQQFFCCFPITSTTEGMWVSVVSSSSPVCERHVCRWDIEARLREKEERNRFCMNVKYIHFSTGVTRKQGSSHVRALTYKLTWKVLIKHGRRATWRIFKAICVFKRKESGWKLYRKKRLTN